MLISGLHPRVSGSVDAESGLGANISSTFSVWALRLLKTAVHSVEGQEKDKAGEREVAKKKKKKIYIYIYTHTHTYSSPGRAENDFITIIKLACILRQSMENCSSIDNLMRISTGKCEGGLVLVILSVPHPHLHPDVLFSALHCAWEAHLSRPDLPDRRITGTLKKPKGGSKEGVFTSRLLQGCLLYVSHRAHGPSLGRQGSHSSSLFLVPGPYHPRFIP